MATRNLSRRDLLWKGGATGAVVGAMALGVPGLAYADESHGSDLGGIYQLQAAFP